MNLNQDKAATVIQRHVKGYCVRRKYGPLITTTGKLDNATALFIKEYFKRWKTKSIFQVLLLYRAQKHQDLIYFSQQVHLYSQNAVSAMSALRRKNVDVKKVRADLDIEEFIGRESLAVWKLPFRIKELPFLDSSDLCKSVYERLEPGDDMPWDEPFKILHKGCQTTLNTSGVGFETMRKQKKKFTSFVDTPYDRDPESAHRNYSRQSYYDDFDEEEFARAYGVPSRGPSPIDRRSSPIDRRSSPIDRRSSLTPRNSLVPPSTPKKSPGKKAPPPPPLFRQPQPVVEEEDNNNHLIDFRKKLRPTRNLQKIDPVLELERKGKELYNTSSENEDDPPYNFQAMLRKTDNRFAVHKGKTNENSDATNNNARNNINVQVPATGNKKCFIRKDSFENLKKMVATSKDFAREGCMPNAISENGNDLRNEILPGFVVIGKCTDL